MPPRETRFKRMRRERGVAGDYDDEALELGDVIGDVIGDAIDVEPLHEAVEQLGEDEASREDEQLGEDDGEVAAAHDKELIDGWAGTLATLQPQAEALAKKYGTANTRALVEVTKRLRAQVEAARKKPGIALEDKYRAEREEISRQIDAAVSAYKTMVQAGGKLPADQERALRAGAGGGEGFPWLLLAGGTLAYYAFQQRKKPRRKRR